MATIVSLLKTIKKSKKVVVNGSKITIGNLPDPHFGGGTYVFDKFDPDRRCLRKRQVTINDFVFINDKSVIVDGETSVIHECSKAISTPNKPPKLKTKNDFVFIEGKLVIMEGDKIDNPAGHGVVVPFHGSPQDFVEIHR